MNQVFSYADFRALYPDNESCLEEIRKFRYPAGILCTQCKQITKHYKVKGRTAYSCITCRSQVYPLTGTIFEKTTTSLTLWFEAMFLMAQTKGTITSKQLQRELGVTYKTAWRIHVLLRRLMEQGSVKKLTGTFDINNPEADQDSKVRRWSFFNTIEITYSQTKEKAG